MSKPFVDSLEDEIPQGCSFLKRSYWYTKVFIPVGILGKLKAIANGIVHFVVSFPDSGVEDVVLKGFSDSLGEDSHKVGV